MIKYTYNIANIQIYLYIEKNPWLLTKGSIKNRINHEK
jgi:hypothetical protein